MGREFELKYRATPQQQTALRAAFGDFAVTEMETTYYDTADGAMSARKITLRRRLESGRSICTVKTPAHGGGRGEWETECDSIEVAISELCKLGCPAELNSLSAEGLVPICGARLTRQAGTFTLLDCTVELALDQGVLFAGAKEIPLCEIEVELKSGEPEAAIAFGMELQRGFALTPQRKSKFRRALALAKGE